MYKFYSSLARLLCACPSLFPLSCSCVLVFRWNSTVNFVPLVGCSALPFFFCFPSSTQNFLFRVKFDEILFFSPSRNSRIFYLVTIWNTDFLLIEDNKNSKTRSLDFFHPDLSNSKFSQQRFRYRLNFGNSIIKLHPISDSDFFEKIFPLQFQ